MPLYSSCDVECLEDPAVQSDLKCWYYHVFFSQNIDCSLLVRSCIHIRSCEYGMFWKNVKQTKRLNGELLWTHSWLGDNGYFGSRHLDDITQTVRIIFVCCLIMFEYMATVGFHCISSEWNAFSLWNSVTDVTEWLHGSGKLTRSSTGKVVRRKWVRFQFWVKLPFEGRHGWMK